MNYSSVNRFKITSLSMCMCVYVSLALLIDAQGHISLLTLHSNFVNCLTLRIYTHHLLQSNWFAQYSRLRPFILSTMCALSLSLRSIAHFDPFFSSAQNYQSTVQVRSLWTPLLRVPYFTLSLSLSLFHCLSLSFTAPSFVNVYCVSLCTLYETPLHCKWTVVIVEQVHMTTQ